LNEYRTRVPASEPEADFEQRNALYAMKYHVLLSIMYSDDKGFRETLMKELKLLLETIDVEVSESNYRDSRL
jgi:hypothetical protein